MWAWANNSVGQANGSRVDATTSAPPFTPQYRSITRKTMQWPTQDNNGSLAHYNGYINPYTGGFVNVCSNSGQNTHGHLLEPATCGGVCNAKVRNCATFTGCLGQYMTGLWGNGGQGSPGSNVFKAPFSATRGGPWGYYDVCYQTGTSCFFVGGDPGFNNSFQRICVNNSTGLQSTWNMINNMCMQSDIRLKTNISYL